MTTLFQMDSDTWHDLTQWLLRNPQRGPMYGEELNQAEDDAARVKETLEQMDETRAGALLDYCTWPEVFTVLTLDLSTPLRHETWRESETDDDGEDGDTFADCSYRA